MRRYLFLCFVLLLLASCGTVTPTPVIITATPDVIVTIAPVATNTPIVDATPTQEIIGELFRVVNSNPYFAGTSEWRLESNDTLRYQQVGAGYEPTARYLPECRVRVAPYINQYFITGGGGASRLSLEFIQICGEFGVMTRQQLVAQTCYYLKISGFISAVASPGQGANFANLRMGARIHLGNNGSAIELREQAFPVSNGSYEVFWITRPSQSESVMLEMFMIVPWAEWDVLAVNELRAFEVLEAHDSQCPDNATFDF